jgi:sensor domain CHASE-containing protein
MDEQRFTQLVEQLNEYEGVEEVFLLNNEGEIVFKSTSIAPLTGEEAKALLKSWKEKEPSLNYQNSRYAILKNDDIQLAAKNISGGKGNIAGSITKEGDFLIAHISPETGMILLEWSIFVNKVAWS